MNDVNCSSVPISDNQCKDRPHQNRFSVPLVCFVASCPSLNQNGMRLTVFKASITPSEAAPSDVVIITSSTGGLDPFIQRLNFSRWRLLAMGRASGRHSKAWSRGARSLKRTRTEDGQLHQNAPGASGWSHQKPFIFYIELVAGVRFELTTFGLSQK